MKPPKYFYFVVKTTLTGVELVDRSDRDVVEIVRCGECKHHEVCKNGVNGWCNEHERPTDVTYFCADGERKEEQ